MSVSRAYFATCAKGLEYLLRDELAALGASDVHEKLAGVAFAGELAIGYRACLESRLASRILMPLAEFDVQPNELPLTPPRLWRLIKDARARQANHRAKAEKDS